MKQTRLKATHWDIAMARGRNRPDLYVGGIGAGTGLGAKQSPLQRHQGRHKDAPYIDGCLMYAAINAFFNIKFTALLWYARRNPLSLTGQTSHRQGGHANNMRFQWQGYLFLKDISMRNKNKRWTENAPIPPHTTIERIPSVMPFFLYGLV